MKEITFVCPDNENELLIKEGEYYVSPVTQKKFSIRPVLDLMGEQVTQVSDHYTTQWSSNLGFANLMKNADAAKFTPGRQLGWPELFKRIRSEAMSKETFVLDAACGFGGIFMELFSDPVPEKLFYLGADFHSSLGDIVVPSNIAGKQAMFVRWDISKKLPVQEKFDYVICRAALHHTAEPEKTLRSLVDVLHTDGTLAITVYTQKAPMREALDDHFRDKIAALPNNDAWEVVKQFTKLGCDLQAVNEKITIVNDLPFLGIKAGEYGVQEFIYDHFMKCWYNNQFGEHSNIVNFDWYHPSYAYRYTLEQITTMVESVGLTVKKTDSIKAQHYLECIKK
ncbi:hypothetical protein BH10PSE19_BH10PSE19_20400 [soil metagenome]